MQALARTADIFVENYRPGVMETLGLDYASLSAINPRLIYASISGYGQTGPDRNKGGFDLVAQGVSGIMSVTGEPGGAPVKSGIPLTDLGAGLFATVGILAALESRHRTGRGQHVDTSLLDAGVGLSVWEATQYFSGRGIPERLGLGASHERAVPGVQVRGRLHHDWRRQRPDVPSHLRRAQPSGMARRCPSSRRTGCASATARTSPRAIEAMTAAQPRAHWLELFEANSIPCGPINDYSQVFQDPQVIARELVVDVQHPTLGAIKALGSPIKLSATPADRQTARTAARRAHWRGSIADRDRGSGIGDQKAIAAV